MRPITVLTVMMMVSATLIRSATWTRIEPTAGVQPPGRGRAGLGYDPVTRQLVLFGGGNADQPDTWLFDLDRATWTKVDPGTQQQPPPRFSFVYGSGAGRFWIGTGEGADDVFYNDVWQFDFASRIWTLQSSPDDANAPRTRYGAWGGVRLDGNRTELIVSHGFNRKQLRFDDSFVFDLQRRSWRPIPTRDVIPHKRCLGASTVTAGGQLLAFGGCGSGGFGPCPSDEAWRLDVDAASWRPMERFCSDAALQSVLVPIPGGQGRQAVLLGGLATQRPSPLAILDGGLGQWRDLPLEGGCAGAASCPPAAMIGAAAVASADAVYLYAPDGALWRLNGPLAVSTTGPATSSCPPRFDYRTAHGVVMGLSWGVFLPAGVTIARFRDRFGARWFTVHRALQTLGAVLQLVGLVLALQINVIGKLLAVPHAIVGLIVGVLGIQQPINGYLRAHIHPGQAKTRARIWWEYLHKGAGYVAIVAGLTQPVTGLRYLSGALNTVPDPGRGGNTLLIVYSVWVAVLFSLWLMLMMTERRRRSKADTES